jgi:hypothetical protein
MQLVAVIAVIIIVFILVTTLRKRDKKRLANETLSSVIGGVTTIGLVGILTDYLPGSKGEEGKALWDIATRTKSSTIRVYGAWSPTSPYVLILCTLIFTADMLIGYLENEMVNNIIGAPDVMGFTKSEWNNLGNHRASCFYGTGNITTEMLRQQGRLDLFYDGFMTYNDIASIRIMDDLGLANKAAPDETFAVFTSGRAFGYTLAFCMPKSALNDFKKLLAKTPIANKLS